MGKSEIDINRSCKVLASYDVIVCGGGPAGFTAAVSAARMGMRTAIIERQGFFGGLATAGLVSPISEFNMNGRRVIGGIAWETMERLAETGGADLTWRIGNIPFDPECYKLILQKMLIEAGVAIYLECSIIDCAINDRCLTHIICSARCGLFALEGKCFIDCSGDAVLSLAAGVSMQPMSVECQPATLCFRLGGVDTAHLENICFSEPDTRYYNKRIKEILEYLNEPVPQFGGPWFCFSLHEGVVTVNMTRATADINDPISFSAAACRLRKDAMAFTELLRCHVKEFKDCWIIETASIVGCRESRRILGAHTLTGPELLSGIEPDDAIAVSAHPIDIHSAADSSQRVIFLDREGYIPYRALYAPEYPNLLTAGRCLSADREAFASVRVQAPCMATGEAAGCAAAMAVKSGIPVGDVDVALLRKNLGR